MTGFTNDNSWEKWAHTSNKALQEAEYIRAVAHSTLALEQLADTQAAILDIRATAYTKTGRFAHALADAKQMIVLVPQSPQGYLRAGELYRVHGKQLLALQIYNQGLRNVSVTDPAHGILMQERKATLEQSRRRVDFVAALPYDLMASLVPYIPIDTFAVCLEVSKTWRERFLGCPHGCQKVVINGGQPWSAAAYNVALTMGSHIQSLSIQFMEDPAPTRLLKQLAEGLFGRLNTLVLRRCKIGQTDYLLEALWQVKHTLTNLSLISILDGTVPLQAILSVCPQLQTLKHKRGIHLGYIESSLLPDTLALTSLELEAVDMRATQLEPLLRRCPNMRHLAVYQCEAAVLGLIHQYCPNLEHLYFNIYRMMMDSENIPTKEPSKGLTTLHLGRVKWDVVQLLPFLLSKARNTLEDLRLEIDLDDSGSPTDWKPILDMHYDAITSLSVNMPDSLQSVVSTLILRCPNLESVSFDYAPMVGPEVLLSLSALERVSKLMINSVPHLSRIGIEAFLHKHCTLKHESSLRSFEADRVNELSKEALILLAGIPTLETIRLDNCSNVPVDGMKLFADNLSMYSTNLTRLNLCNLAGVSDDTLHTLSQVSRLEHLWLMRLALPTDSGVIYLVSTSMSLKTISIYDCANVSHYTMKYAMKILKDKCLTS